MTERFESDVIGFEVEALDGVAGKVADLDSDGHAGCLLVKIGMLGKRHVVPGSRVSAVDRRRHRVYVGMTKDQIRLAPRPRDVHDAWMRAQPGPFEAGSELDSLDRFPLSPSDSPSHRID